MAVLFWPADLKAPVAYAPGRDQLRRYAQRDRPG
jgi:hypothetical protein